MSFKKRLLLIDTFNFLHRAYHALPITLTDAEGNPTNAVYGVTSMLISVFNQIQPQYVVAAMDSEKPTFRVEEFTGYKAHRKPMDNELATQIPRVIEVLDAFGVNQVKVNGYEADDIIGTFVERFSEEVEIVIVSNDRDLWQLLRENVAIMIPKNGGAVEWVGVNEAEKRLGFSSDLLVEYKALRGDPSDNIPGVYGVGDKTAKKLILQYGTVEEIYKHIGEITPESLQKKLANNAEEAVMSKKLAQIILDVPFEAALSECTYKQFNKNDVKEILEKYNFKSLIKRLGFSYDKKGVAREASENQLALFS
jgi:DNA polymerase-1